MVQAFPHETTFRICVRCYRRGIDSRYMRRQQHDCGTQPATGANAGARTRTCPGTCACARTCSGAGAGPLRPRRHRLPHPLRFWRLRSPSRRRAGAPTRAPSPTAATSSIASTMAAPRPEARARGCGGPWLAPRSVPRAAAIRRRGLRPGATSSVAGPQRRLEVFSSCRWRCASEFRTRAELRAPKR
jgi:hypothetical protein